MPTSNTSSSGRKAGPLSGIKWSVSTPNTVAIIGLLALALLLALRAGFRPVNIG